jgi:hypothetical protein
MMNAIRVGEHFHTDPIDMTLFVADPVTINIAPPAATSDIRDALLRLWGWLETNDYSAYDTFDGLSAPLLRRFTFDRPLARIALQQSVRRFPINLRPFLGIRKSRSSKGMGFLARGFIRLARTTGEAQWDDRAVFCLKWLTEHQSKGYSGASWGNHFEYQSRNGSIPQGVPTVVWSSLIGHAFLDAYEHYGENNYLEIATSICRHFMSDIRTLADGDSVCLNYTPGPDAWVHNANTLGAAFLARTYNYTGAPEYIELARKAMRYTARHQLPNGAWYYAEKSNCHWVDNFHTAYVLDCFKHYRTGTGDNQFDDVLARGYTFWKDTFFLADGTPKYYDYKTLPIDIQCSAQAIDTLSLFADQDPEAIPLAVKVARWTIANMQDRSGYFYYRRYSRWIVNRTPTLHWGQATMLCGLAGLYRELVNLRERE